MKDSKAIKKRTDKASGNKRSQEAFEKKKLKIIKKATRLFIKKGFDQTSMRQISQATGIDVSYLYNFIKSKEEILYLAFEQIHSPMIELFEKHGIEELEDPEIQLRTVIRESTKLNYEFQDDTLLLYRESKTLPKKYLKIILSRESNLVSRVEQILIKLNEKRKLNIQNFQFVANMIVYQTSFYPLRDWNFKNCTREELMDLTEKYIMNAILTYP